MSELVLSLFPGIGLLDRAFEETGFCVVRGPDVLWGGDVRRFSPPPGRFDGIIGGPPCQAFSRLQEMVKLNRTRELLRDPDSTRYALAPNLIPEFVRVVEAAQPGWWLMENVPYVPEVDYPRISGYFTTTFVLNNRWVGGVQNRTRRFWFGTQGAPLDLTAHLVVDVLEPQEYGAAVLASGSRRSTPIGLNRNGVPKRLNKVSASVISIADTLRLQGLPADFFAHSPFTVEGQQRVLGNGVPLPLGRAIAGAVRAALVEEGT